MGGSANAIQLLRSSRALCWWLIPGVRFATPGYVMQPLTG